jgi:glycerophosphoryl diester phosphodiesterase
MQPLAKCTFNTIVLILRPHKSAYETGILFFLCLMLCSSCRKDPVLWHIDNLNNDRVLIFGHGGMGYRSRLPMNSLPSLERCLGTSADGAEMDLQLSRDSVIILYHDGKLEDGTTCSGTVNDVASATLKDCRYRKGAKKHGLLFADDFFSGRGNVSSHLYTLECKLGAGEKGAVVRRFVTALSDLIKRHRLQEMCLVESQNVAFLGLLEQELPEVDTYYYCGKLQDALDIKYIVPITGLTISMNRISSAEIRRAHSEGLKVSIFGMSTERDNLEALSMSPDQVQTDKLEHLLEVYRK